jgi:2-C-methyl-D-erythritol 4-phosphate cytidylyltransferase
MQIENNSATTITCIVPAGGSGSRFGGDIPKQYLPLAGAMLFTHTVRRLLAVSAIDRVIVCVSPDEVDRATHGLAAADLQSQRVLVAPLAGATRAQTVLNGIRHAQSQHPQQQHWALVHDAARPLVKPEHITQLIISVTKHITEPVTEQVTTTDGMFGGILAIPVADTLKRANESGAIAHTVPRDQLWQAQTPQLFRLSDLIAALEWAAQNDFAPTDEAQAIEQYAEHSSTTHQTLLVQGDSSNIKVTRPSDFAYAQWLLQH